MRVTLALLAVIAAPALAESHHVAHPPRVRPAGVPEGYVFTHSGFFHPSCVYTVHDDEVWSPGAILGRDGSVHERVAPCAYPRFGSDGRMFSGGPRISHPGGGTPDLSGPFGDYQGWLLYFLAGVANGKTVPADTTISSTWVVPSIPPSIGYQDLAFFNGLELDAEHTDVIVQPVLDFSELPGQWAIESETCCYDGNDTQSDLTGVSPGDVIRGTVVPQGCNATTGICTTMAITTTDLTTGKSQVLMATSHELAVNEIDGAVFETYSVDTCAQLPSSGEVVIDGTLLTSTGATVPMTYLGGNCVTSSCLIANGSLTNVPTACGWGVSQAGDSFTLTFGQSPFIVDGGTPQLGLDLGTIDMAMRPVDLAVAPDDLAVAPATKKHGCEMAPVGSAPSRASWLVVALLALSCARGAARHRAAIRSTRCRP